MNEYTASNGVRIAIDDRPGALHPLTVTSLGLMPQTVESLREFFRAEEDERLGKWRWGNSDIIVRPVVVNETLYVRAIDEAAGTFLTYEAATVRGLVTDDPTQDERVRAMRAYLDAHPESPPIPNEPRTAWVDKYGTDVWHVGTDGVLRCVLNPGSDPAKYAPFTRLVPEAS